MITTLDPKFGTRVGDVRRIETVTTISHTKTDVDRRQDVGRDVPYTETDCDEVYGSWSEKDRRVSTTTVFTTGLHPRLCVRSHSVFKFSKFSEIKVRSD